MPNNSFTGTNIHVGNTACRSVIDEIMHFRTQMTYKDEMKSVGGWNDPLNHLMASSLSAIRETLSLTTHQQADSKESKADKSKVSKGQAERNAARAKEAQDESLLLKNLFDQGNPIHTDDTQMPAGFQATLPYDFSGKNPDYPQMSDPKFKNVWLKQFIVILDMAVNNISNLACAGFGNTIVASQSVMIHSRLQQAFAIIETKGGTLNMPEIADGTDPESLTGKVGVEIAEVVIPDPIENA